MKYFKDREVFIRRNLEEIEGMFPVDVLEAVHDMITEKAVKANKEDAISVLNAFNMVLWAYREKSGIKKGKGLKPVTGNLKHINGRLAEGNTVDELILVIEFKFQDWWGTEQEMYLRPTTLFNSTKFPGYLTTAESYQARQDKLARGRNTEIKTVNGFPAELL